jgi:hypothetical protein
MGKTLCATRGGEASYRTQDAAIALAKERGDELVFLSLIFHTPCPTLISTLSF